jgi:hypothetical protein
MLDEQVLRFEMVGGRRAEGVLKRGWVVNVHGQQVIGAHRLKHSGHVSGRHRVAGLRPTSRPSRLSAWCVLPFWLGDRDRLTTA